MVIKVLDIMLDFELSVLLVIVTRYTYVRCNMVVCNIDQI